MPPTREPRGRARRGGAWQWLVPAACALVSLAHLLFAGVHMLHFEPTHDALFTEFVYRPLARAAGQALAVALASTVIAVALRRWRTGSAALFGLSLVCTACVLAVAALTVDGYRATEHRKHPEARLLAALRDAPVGPGWRVVDPPALDAEESLPGPELVAPGAHATFIPKETEHRAACAELEAVLGPAGWDQQQASSCWFLHVSNGVRVSATVTDEGSGPTTVRLSADPVTR